MEDFLLRFTEVDEKKNVPFHKLSKKDQIELRRQRLQNSMAAWMGAMGVNAHKAVVKPDTGQPKAQKKGP